VYAFVLNLAAVVLAVCEVLIALMQPSSEPTPVQSAN